jgi:hypothetical protein
MLAQGFVNHAITLVIIVVWANGYHVVGMNFAHFNISLLQEIVIPTLLSKHIKRNIIPNYSILCQMKDCMHIITIFCCLKLLSWHVRSYLSNNTKINIIPTFYHSGQCNILHTTQQHHVFFIMLLRCLWNSESWKTTVFTEVHFGNSIIEKICRWYK